MGDLVLPPDTEIDSEQVWIQKVRDVPPGTPALFLDRDGVVVVEANYLHKVEDAHLEDGAAEMIARANARGIAVVIVTNQAGIARGYYGWAEFAIVQEKILADLEAAGARVDAVLACPHHASGQPPFQHPDHPARKPNPGMLLRAQEMLDLDMGTSWIVGDRASDLKAGRNAGIAGGIHVLTGHGAREGEREKALAVAENGFLTRAADSIAGLADVVPLLAD